MSNPFWTDGFGAVPPRHRGRALRRPRRARARARDAAGRRVRDRAVQAEAGIRVPEPEYLRERRRRCAVASARSSSSTRCRPACTAPGPFLAAHRYGVEPDMVVLAKAMSGGLVPVGAVLMSEAINKSVYSSHPPGVRPHVDLQREQPRDAGRRSRRSTCSRTSDLGRRARPERRAAAREAPRAARGVRDGRRGARRRPALGHRVQAAALDGAPPRLRRVREDPPGDVRPGARHAPVPRPRDPQPDLRQRLHGAEGRAARSSSRTRRSTSSSTASTRSSTRMHSSPGFWAEALGLAKRVLM